MKRLLLLSLLCVTVSAASVMRVGLAPLSRRVEGAPPAPALLSFLHGWSNAHQYLRPVDDERAAEICNWLNSGAMTLADEAFFREFNAFQPIDAWIAVAGRDEGATVAVTTAAGTQRLALSAAQLRNFREAARASCAFIEKTLAVAADAAAPSVLNEFASDEAAIACHLMPLTSERWPRNSGAARLERIRPYWSVGRAGPALANSIIEAALEQVTARNRSQEFTPQVMAAARAALPMVLGTRYEANAARLLAEAAAETFRDTLLTLARKVAEDELLAMPDLRLDAAPATAMTAMPAGDPLGAVRLLGRLKANKESLAMLQLLAKAATPAVRRAVALALLERAENQAVAALAALEKDGDRHVAFIARLGAWRRAAGAVPAPLGEARALLPEAGDLLWAVAEVLAAAGTDADLPALRALGVSGNPAIRRAAVMANLRLEPRNETLLLSCLGDVDATIMRQALFSLSTNSAPLTAATTARLLTLCNDPQATVGEAARLAAQAMRPAGRWQQLEFDLATEHPWLRRKIIAGLAREEDNSAQKLLLAACTNRNPRTRAEALLALAERAPEAGRRAACTALADPHRNVRLHAAALLARQATSAETSTIAAAAAGEKDAAVRLYLETAAARLNGKPLEPRPGAHSASGSRALTWMCGMGSDAATSPYTAYYNTSLNVSDTWRAAHAAGKVCFVRLDVVSQPGLAVLDPSWEDRSWLSIDYGLPLADLGVIDGVVYGEETMSFNTASLWPAGWRLFCLEAAIDPRNVAGNFDALDARQKLAWNRWALERHIDGFNQLYDDTKLRFALLRPGLQVATFMTEQGGPTPADLRWKFDVGGIYDYKGSSRACYYLIRRMKTLWPERPIIWLALGIGGYEMNPVKYNLATPVTPMNSRTDRAYADNLSAWLAGADPGFFSTWIFVRHNFSGDMGSLSGVQILLEDITPKGEKLNAGINYAFNEVEKVYTPAPKAPPAPASTADASDIGDAIFAALDAEKNQKEAQAVKDRISAEKLRMRDGFLFYRQYLDTVATIFNELPRRQWHSRFLGVKSGLSVWSRATDWSDVTGLNLLPECDFLADLNKLPDIGAAQYRTMVVANSARFTDATIDLITSWLRDSPNLLIVSGWLPTAGDAGLPAVGNLGGTLTSTWPWAGDITATASEKPAATKGVALTGKSAITLEQATVTTHYEGKNIEPLWQHQGRTVCAVWRGKGFKGAVIFDGLLLTSPEYGEALRGEINDLAQQGVGVTLPPSSFVANGQEGAISAGASAPVKTAQGAALAGSDWLSGATLPRISPWRSAAITAASFDGRHVVCHDGMIVTAIAPLTVTARAPGSLDVASAGLIQAAGGNLTFTVDGAPLPERPLNAAWLFHENTAGAAIQTWEENGQTQKRWFIRSTAPVRVSINK